MFYFRNTFTEILCVDRDDDPLIFDPNILEDDTYLMDKIAKVLYGRLTLILGMLDGKTTEEIYTENPGMFERIRMRQIDPENPEEAIS